MKKECDSGGALPFVSVIVPVLNEERRIGELTRSILDKGNLEVIVADGGSSDKTVEIASAAGATTLVAPRGRSLQMNAGAEAAKGNILIFLHADTTLPVNFPDCIRETLEDSSVVGGAFRFATDDESSTMNFVAAMANFRSEKLGIVFGDQSIFCRAEVFSSAGGFPRQCMMEDYELVKKLRRMGKFLILPEKAVTSARRWHEVGKFRNSLLNVVLTWAYIGGLSPETICRLHQKGTAWRRSR